MKKKKFNLKPEPVWDNSSNIMQKSLDEREQKLIIQYQMVQQTLEWVEKTLDQLVEKHKKLNKNRSFENENKIEELENQIRFFLHRIEMEQKFGQELKKIERQFKIDKEKFILSQLGDRLSNIILPPT
jgi:hypothetical protein